MSRKEEPVGAIEHAGPVLKVVIVSAGRGAAPWRRALEEQLAGLPQLTCLHMLELPESPNHHKRLTSGAAQAYVLLDRLQHAVRAPRMSGTNDGSNERAITASPDQLVQALRTACGGSPPDLAIYLGMDDPPAWLVNATRLGTIEPWDDSGPIGGADTPWARELLLDEQVVPMRIVHRASGSAHLFRVLQTAHAAQRSVSPVVNARRLITRAVDLLLVSALREWAAPTPVHPESPLGNPGSQAAPPKPLNTPLSSPLAQPNWRQTAHMVRRRVAERALGTPARWHLAYHRLPASAGLSVTETVDTALDTLNALPTFERLTPPDGSFWADPFVIESEGRTLVYFEVQRGREDGTIAVAELHADGRLSTPTTVLDGPGHLSYPHVFEWEGSWWMIPESAMAGEVTLYRCDELPHRWSREVTLIADQQLVDATPFVDAQGQWWMFATRVGVDPFPQEDLLLFTAPAPTGPWTPHRRNPLRSDVRAARPAGAVISADGQLLRLGQDCSVRYGYGLAVHRVTELHNEAYSEEEILRVIPPAHDPSILGVHTFNRSARTAFVDLLIASPRSSANQ